MNPANILGIDIGSVSICIAELSPEKNLIKKSYGFHHGAILDTLRIMLGDFNLSEIRAVAATTFAPSILKVSRKYLEGILYQTPLSGYILICSDQSGILLPFTYHGSHGKRDREQNRGAGGIHNL